MLDYETRTRVAVLSGEVQALRFALGRVMQTLSEEQRQKLQETLVVPHETIKEQAVEMYDAAGQHQEVFFHSHVRVLESYRKTVS